MQYAELGKSDLQVSRLALGTWGLGGGSVWSDKDSTAKEAALLLDTCAEVGINYVDTAPVYGTGLSEELLGQALKGRRQDFILQTKCSLNWRQEGGSFKYARDGYTVNNDTSASAIRRDVEDSLRRLQTDYLDVLIVHYVNADCCPVAETVEGLEALIKEGKIRAYGLSNSQPADLTEYAAAAAQIPEAQGPSLVQEFFSLLSPFHGRSYFPVCAKHQASFQTYGVLEEGFLTGPAFLDRHFEATDIRARIPWTGAEYQAGLRQAFKAWEPLCDRYQCSFANLVEAWALDQFDQMSLLVGMRRPQNVYDNVKCLDMALTEADRQFMEDTIKDIQVEVLDK